MTESTEVRVALVHDWLTGMRGGERCLEVFADLFPHAPILTLFHDKGSVSQRIESHRVLASPLSQWSMLRRRYRKLLPLFPWAINKLPGEDYDLLISLSHCAAKAIPRRPDARHICYCFTPARYLWDHADTYLAGRSLPTRIAARSLLPELQNWDRRTAAGVDHFVAISNYVAERIQRIYGRDSEVIHPPVDCARFTPSAEVGDHYLVVSALTPYKNVELAIRACGSSGRKLRVVGRGEESKKLESLARRYPTVEMVGWLSDDDVAPEYARARAFILPCLEDFGITPLESMAAGRPVIALGHGGALDTVQPGTTGVLFEEPTVESLVGAMEECERTEWSPQACQNRAEEFDLPVFRSKLVEMLARQRVG